MKRRSFMKLGAFFSLVSREASAQLIKGENIFFANDADPIENSLLLSSIIHKINKLGGEQPVTIVIENDLSITEKNTVELSPFKKCSGKNIYGLPVIEKNNVTILGGDKTVSVSKDLFFSKMETKLCKKSDIFTYVFCVEGRGFSLYNLNIDGNADDRLVMRGKEKRGYGGEEFGLCLLADGGSVESCSVFNFATDSIIISGNVNITNSLIHGSLRNQISVVNNSENPIIVVGDNLRIYGRSASKMIRPGSGLHIESKGGIATAYFKNSEIGPTFGSGIRLSVGSKNCLFENLSVIGDVDIVDRNECNHDGHLFVNCNIEGEINKRFTLCHD